MNQNERMIKIATASPSVLDRVDRVLEGRAETQAAEANVKTITLTNAAERLGVSRPTIYRLVKAGEIETSLIGGLERVRLQSLLDYATRPVTRARRAAS